MLHGYFDLPTFTFWKEKNIWTGSLFGNQFNYRIFRSKTDESEDLCAIGWYGPLCFEKTPVTDYAFELHEELSPEGLETLIAKLNEKADEYKKSGGKL